MEILPVGFEQDYAAEMRKIKSPRIHTWKEGQYPEGPCARCVKRYKRASKARVNLSKGAQAFRLKNKMPEDFAPKKFVIEMSIACLKTIEQEIQMSRINKLKKIKYLKFGIFSNEMLILAAKKEHVAFWKMTECEWKRQRPFMYAHNSINE
jgi:hypothetical protein